jgi:hypothetical protein
MQRAMRRRREHVITLRLSARERARLYRAAALLGTSGSELLREALAVRLVHVEREPFDQPAAAMRLKEE